MRVSVCARPLMEFFFLCLPRAQTHSRSSRDLPMENYTTSNQVIAPVNFQDREVFDRTLTREKRDDITADAEITYCSAKKNEVKLY